MGGPLGEAGLNRAKKTPEELAAEAAAADQDDFTSRFLSTNPIFSPIFSPSFFFFFFSIHFLSFSGKEKSFYVFSHDSS